MDRRTTPVLLSITFLLMACRGGGGPTEQGLTGNIYRVSVDSSDLRVVNVHADLTISTDMLSMDWPAVGFLEKGWSTFVQDLKVHDASGRAIGILYKDKAKWVLSEHPDRIQVSYTVRIGHDHMEWVEGGHSASAYVVDDVIYMIGAALFIAEQTELDEHLPSRSRVTFDLPHGYQVCAPWEAADESGSMFTTGSTHELVRSAMLFGNIRSGEMNAGGMNVEMATSNDFSEAIPLLLPIYERMVPAAQRYFADSLAGNYTIIANKAPRTAEVDPYFSGEALHRSMSFIAPAVPDEGYMPLFWHVLTHEYVHTWNGISMLPVEEEAEYWFTEGFTDHIALILQHELGVLTTTELLNQFEVAGYSMGWAESIRKYLASAGHLSMREAGHAKEEKYDLIYSGGAVFALMLDIEMLRSTKGTTGVRELLQVMNKRFGKGARSRFTYADIKNVASELAGIDLGWLFDRYVDGTDVMPVKEMLRKAGLLLIEPTFGHFAISIDKHNSEEERLVLEALIGPTR